MKAKSALVAFLLFLSCSFFAKPSFAALTITGVSKGTINSPDDEIIITASASGLDNKTQYLEAVFTKLGEATSNYFGLTFNQKGEWYQYKSSPSTSDLSSYFYSLIPVNGTWSGQLSAKLDLNDSGFKGSGVYAIKLLKFITSSPTSSNIFSITVDVTPIPSSTPIYTSQSTPISTPTKSPAPASNAASATPKPSTPAPSVVLDDIGSVGAVLGESSEDAILNPSSNPSGTQNPKGKEIVLSSRENNIAKILISLGFVFILACGILFSWPHIRKKLKKDE